MAHYTCDHVREHAHIRMLITELTDGDNLAVLVINVINQFSLGSKILGITSYGGTNLATFKAILESTFDKTGVSELEKPMSMMD